MGRVQDVEERLKAFVWMDVERLTENYHDGGGCVVIAKTLEEARQHLPSGCEAQSKDPDDVYELKGKVNPIAYIFPDAGCC